MTTPHNFRVVTRDDYLGYMCGLIATDGCLTPPKGSGLGNICITLQESDKDTLIWLESQFKHKPKNDLYTFKNTGGLAANPGVQALFSVYSDHLYNYCLDMGITPAKTYTLDPKLDDKSETFKWHFLRGVIDGDGCVSISKRSPGSHKICIFSASPVFLERLQYWFGGKIYASTRCQNLQFVGHQAKRIADQLPKEPHYLVRKTDKLITLAAAPMGKQRTPFTGKLFEIIDSYRILTPSEIWRESGTEISYQGFISRIKRQGMSIEEALNSPVRPKGKRWEGKK